MLKRQRGLLYLLSALQKTGQRVSRTKVDKDLFILSKEYVKGEISFYNFYPHHYGPFSNNYYFDLGELTRLNLLESNLAVTGPGEQEADKLEKTIKEKIDAFLARFDGVDAVKYVYNHYPQYTTKSKLVKHGPQKVVPGTFSIGYEGKDIDSFLDVLIQNGIGVVIDVRANPFSMNLPFVGSKLSKSLEGAEIEYIHVPELGIPGELRTKLDSPENYQELFDYYRKNILDGQRDSLKWLCELGTSKRMAILCFEADHKNCHRGVISEELERITGKSVTHI